MFRSAHTCAGIDPCNRLFSIVITPKNKFPSSEGIVPVIWLFCSCTKSSATSCPILVLIVPVNRLSFKSICRNNDKLNISSGREPARKLKFMSNTSRVAILPTSVGIVPEITPSWSCKNFNEVNARSSDANVPDNPFRSEKDHTQFTKIKMPSEIKQ